MKTIFLLGFSTSYSQLNVPFKMRCQAFNKDKIWILSVNESNPLHSIFLEKTKTYLCSI